jgi:hypothetical protein
MNPGPEIRLDGKQISELSSRYIDVGVKKDCWEIMDIKISGMSLKARLRMTSFFVSPTDPAGFHLTIFSTQEFLAQLANIYLHVLAGYTSKCKETWMRECSVSCRSSIRNPENITVDMDISRQKKVGDTLIGKVNCRVCDDQGGLFTARLEGLLH